MASKRDRAAVAPAPEPADGDLGFITDKQAVQLGLDPETASAVVEDAADVYAYINQTPSVTRSELAGWAASKWGKESGAVDRLNAALGYLQRAGKVIGFA